MKSFRIPTDTLKRLEERLQGRIDEVERLREGFPIVVERLKTAAEQLKTSPLGSLVNSPVDRQENAALPMSPAEALSFTRRHSVDKCCDGSYQQMVRYIRKDHGELELSNALLMDLHARVVGHEAHEPGRWKGSDNYFPIVDQYGIPASSILTVDWKVTPRYMEHLEEGFDLAWDSHDLSRVLLIALYWLDLLGIHPFHDGNGRVSRLAVTLLLLQSGHHVARYTSLESLVGRRRTEYITSLRSSLNGWNESKHDPYPWCLFVIDSIRDAYIDVSNRTEALISVIEQAEAVSVAIESTPREFLVADLLVDLPDLQEGFLLLILNLAHDENKLRPSMIEGQVRWEKTNPRREE